MAGRRPKAFLMLGGKPLFRHSLDSFRRVRLVREIVLTVPPGYEKRVRVPGVRVVAGGRTRQDSVARGLQVLSTECDVVVVHDTARPLVTESTILRILRAAKRHGAALTAAPTVDTIKLARHGRVVRTLDRSTLWNAQTPQAFRAPLMRRAFSAARAGGARATDCSGLLERIGVRPLLIPPDAPNPKVTLPEDLTLAALLLRRKLGRPY